MSTEVTHLEIPDVKLIATPKFVDRRGFLSEIYNREALGAAGIDADFVQDNYSLSTERGTLRGLHFQIAPFAQAKLVRVMHGAIYDVAVDLRRGSPTYGRHVAAVLSASAWNQLYVPIGFAHGFVTLEPATEVIYKVSAPYSPGHERGLLWNDPELAIAWPIAPTDAILADRDKGWPSLTQLADVFDDDPVDDLASSRKGRERT
jgi:dTDP-4-dehydrorhamnose 3,5-epimerase